MDGGDVSRSTQMLPFAILLCAGATMMVSVGSTLAQDKPSTPKVEEDQATVARGSGRSDSDGAQEELQQVTLAEDRLSLQIPSDWEPVDPRSRIIEREFVVPPPEGERVPGRLTMMQSGGGAKANIDRWKGQFVPSDAANSDRQAAVDEREIAGLRVHVVDLSGTFLDRPGPFAPGVERPDYRMLGAIVETKEAGDYYVKFYGPAATVAAHRDAFDRMIESLQWGDR